jgi:glucokinase
MCETGSIVIGVDVVGTNIAVGVGIPGVVHEGHALTVPNLIGWTENVELVRLLGEWTAVAARGGSNILGLWMETGVGGGPILDGRPCVGSRGAAGEIGYVVVLAGGALCTCGRRGCAEAHAGRRSLRGVATAMVDTGWKTSLFTVRDDEGKTKLTATVWAKALGNNDPLATKLFDTAIETLGIAIGSTVNLLDLDRVVIGGGLAEKLGPHLAERLFDAAIPWMLQPDPDLKFVVAGLEDDAGVVGAAVLARAALIAD